MTKALLLALLMLPTVSQAEGRDIPYSKMNPLLSVETQSPLIQITLSVEITDASLIVIGNVCRELQTLNVSAQDNDIDRQIDK